MANESANANEATNTLKTSEGNEVTVKLIDGVCVVTTEDATASLTAPIVIEKPAAGETVQLDVVPGQKYFFDFNENNVQSFIQDGDNLTLNFADGSSIILEGFGTAASGVLPATLAFSDALSADELEGLIQVVDTTPDQEDLEDPQAEVRETETEDTASSDDGSDDGQQVAAVEPAAGEPSAEQVAQIEPAAGDEAGGNQNTGFGFGSSFDAQGVIGLEDVGPIDPTALEYGVEFFNEDLLPQDEEPVQEDDDPIILSPAPLALDESFLGPLAVSDTLVVDFGNDGPGTITPDGTPVTVSGSSQGGATLLSNGNVVDIQPTADGYIGTINGGVDTVFTLVIDPQTGDYTFTQLLAIDHADPNNPDDVIELAFGVQAEDSSGDVATAQIIVNIADAAPIAEDSLQVVDETDLPGVVVNGAVPVDFSSDGPGAVTANDTFNSSGSQLGGNLTSGGDTVNVTLVGDTYIGHTGANPNANQVFTLQVNADGTYAFELLGTLDHADPNDPNDIINLEFGVSVTDFDGDQDEATITIQVKDDVPVIGDSRGDVDETNLDGGPISTSDTLPTSFGSELNTIGPDGAIATEAGGGPIALTSGGQPVDIQQTADGYIGTINGGVDTVFTITIDPNTAQYVYTQFAPFDHPDDTDPNDTIELSFGVVITNNDGDSDNGTITISVADDGPIANDDVTGAEEGQVITGDVTANDDLSEDVDNTVTQVEFGGNTFNIPDGGNSGPIVTPLGTFILNSDGTYEFTATDIGDPDGTLTFTYTLVDSDGDSDTAELSIRVTPDGEPVAVTDEMTVDETNLTPGPLVINETLPVDFGLDGPGTIDPNGTISFGGSALGGNLTSGGQPVDIVQTANGYEGVIQGTNIQVFELIVQDNGDYSFELFQTLDHANPTDPNDLIQLNFGITISDADGDTADGTIIINVLDDAPVAFDDGNTVLQNTLVANGNVVTNDIQGEDTPSTVTAISFNGNTIPVAGPTVINGDHGTLTINPDGTYEYVSNGTNIVTVVDEFTYTLTDFDGDSDTAELTITIRDIDTRPEISAGFEVVDETDLPGVQESGQLDVDYGADGPGEVLATDTFTAGGSLLGGNLTSNNETVNVTLVGDTYIGHTGANPNANQIFTLQINTDGSYTFDLLGTLDHADPNDPNDIITLEFGVEAVDSDGDATPSVILVNVLDDVPTIGNQVGDVDESNFENGPISTSNTLFTDFGTEVTSFTPDGGVRAEVGGNPINLTSGGEMVVFTQTANGYIGTINGGGTTVFELVMNPVTGQYEYTQFLPFDHPDDTDPDDVIDLFFDFEVTNTDGDTATGTVQVAVADDGPIANDDFNGAAEGQTITGSVTANDDFSEDTPNTVTQVEFGGNTFIIPDGGNSGPIVTPLGTLILNSDGSYEFDAVDTGDPDGTVTFTYTLTGGDLDTDTADLVIRVTPDGEPIIVSGENIVDETALTPGPLVINESLNVDFGLDGPGSVDPNGTTSFGGSATNGNLTSNDVPVVIQQTANGYEGVLQGTTTQVFELILQDNGDYSFELFGPLDHADGSDPNDAIQLHFGVTATDFGGDAATATITINVLDDAPIANDDVNMYDTNAGVANGNVITGLNGGPGAADDLSEDNAAPESADHDVVQVRFGNTVVDIPAGGSNTIAGDFGTLTMFDDGTYTYELNPGVILPGGGTSMLNPDAADVAGVQTSFTNNGITVTSTSGEDLTWWNGIGPGVGVGPDQKVWPNGDGLDVDFALAETVEFQIGDIGSNNVNSSLRFDLNFEDGSSETVIFDIGSATVVNGIVTVSFDSADYGGKLIDSVGLPYYQSSFVLSNVTVTHPGDDCIVDEFEYVLQDGDGDQSTATLTLKGKDLIDDQPKLETSEVMVDETDLNPTDDASNTVTADFGADGPGTYALVDLDSFNGAENNQLTSNGVAVVVGNEGGDLVGRANGNEVFRLELNETTGAYTFTLTGVLDHADETNPDDVIQLFFNVTATDIDGDTSGGIITVNVKDDGPFIDSKARPIDEDGLVNGPISYTHTLNHSYGEDGQGEIRPTGDFSAHYQVGGQNQTLMSMGQAVDVQQTADGYIGTIDGGNTTVFTLSVQNNGEYTYTQFKAIDHPDASNPDDVIWLKFGVEIVDFDGDTDQATIIVDLHDGAPEAHDDCVEFNAADGAYTDNVIDNDQAGPDVPPSVTQVIFGGMTYDVPADGSDTVINGDFGALTINNTGEYTYDLFDGAFNGTGTTYSFSKDNPPGSDAGGDIKNVATSYNETTKDFTFSMTIDDISEGFTVAINNGPNPKGHGGEMALIYFDASGAQPVVSVYAYNGLNTQTSWMDGSAAGGTQAPDQILNSIANAGLFSNIEVIDNGDGTKTFNLAMDATTIQNFDPTYGPDGEWSGVSFDNELGIWLHPVTGLDTSYDQDGFLTQWDIHDQGWYDTSHQPTEITTTHEDCVEDQFEYVLSDADGDTDTALLKIKAFAPEDVFIVGDNVDDVDGEQTPWVVGGGNEAIIGSAGNDILVGDAGGSRVVNQDQDYNFVYILDVSGSMGDNDPNDGQTSKIELLIEAVKNQMQQFDNYQNGQIKVHLVTFSTNLSQTLTIDFANPNALNEAVAFLMALDGDGLTNYEAPLQSAVSWLSGNEPLGGDAITTTYFISDGQPNRHLDDQGNVINPPGTNAEEDQIIRAEITGTTVNINGTDFGDDSDEVGALKALSDEVVAVGIDVPNNENLNLIDSDATATYIDDPNDLDLVLSGANPLNQLAAVGGDVIEGGDRGDLIFGDVLNTDQLAQDQGLTTNPGAGWEVFERLENGEGLNAAWDRADTLDYIRANSEELAEESENMQGDGRDGGDDIIGGGAGDDTIFGQEGDDRITGGAGDDTLYGGSGADAFIFESIADGVDTVKDFDIAEGDVLDVSALLIGYNALQDSINDFVFATEVGGDTIISVDENGSGNIANATQIAVLEAVTGLDLEDATNNGQTTV